jgi:hypothetical protein
MSDQKENHGHHAITREAVRQFFASGRGAGNPPRIDGMTELEYFHALDGAQDAQDVAVHVPGMHGEGIPTYGTSVPAAVDGAAQRQHGMADPAHTGQENLDTNRQYVENELSIAHEGGTRRTEMSHLGAATHALEDSYSEAHDFRGSSVDAGDPHAPVESINVWEPRPHQVHGEWHGKGLSEEQGTHDERFDSVPVQGDPNLDQNFAAPVPLVHGSDRAAAAATAEMLGSYHDHRGDSMGTANAANHDTVGQFYQAPQGGPAVNRDEGDPAWIAERDRRLREHEAEDAAPTTPPATPSATSRPAEPNQSTQPAEPNASYQPAEPNQSTQPAEPNASYQPAEPNQSYQPAEPNQSTQPAEPNQSTQPAEPNQSTQPAEPNASYDPAQTSSQ